LVGAVTMLAGYEFPNLVPPEVLGKRRRGVAVFPVDWAAASG
jgi:hypothetical protein